MKTDSNKPMNSDIITRTEVLIYVLATFKTNTPSFFKKGKEERKDPLKARGKQGGFTIFCASAGYCPLSEPSVTVPSAFLWREMPARGCKAEKTSV